MPGWGECICAGRCTNQSTRAALIPHFDLLGQQRPRNKVLLVFQCCAHQSRQWNIFGRFFPTAAISLDWRLHSFLKVDRWQVQKSVFLGAILYFQIRGRRYCFIFNFEQKAILLEWIRSFWALTGTSSWGLKAGMEEVGWSHFQLFQLLFVPPAFQCNNCLLYLCREKQIKYIL